VAGEQVGAPYLSDSMLSKRVPTRNIILALACTNVIEAQGETPRPDTSQDCSLVGRLSIVADLLIAGSVDVRVARAGPGERGRSTGGDVGVAVLPVVS